MTVALA